MSERFRLSAEPKPPLEIASALKSGSPRMDHYLGQDIYVNSDPQYLARQRSRLAQTVNLHHERVGDIPMFLIRAPGRLNAFLEYLDMCAGDHMSTTIDGDVPVAVSAREDDTLSVANANSLFAPAELCLSAEFNAFASAPWGENAKDLEDNWDHRTLIHPHYGHPQGSWLNYVLSPYLRVLWDNPALGLRGANLTFGPATAPFRAGTSSSSAIVVLSFLALYLCNRDRLPERSVEQICKLLGEAEWYVGTHGGANDQTTILRNPANCVLYNRHSKPDLESTPLPFLKNIHVVLANSLWDANKTGGGNQSFNMRKGWMQLGDEIMRLVITAVRKAQLDGKASGDGWLSTLLMQEFRFVPGGKTPLLESRPDFWERIEKNYVKFGSLSEDILGVPDDAIAELILLLPVKIAPQDAGRILGKDTDSIQRIYTQPRRRIGGYHLRTTARFFHKENIVGRALERIFLEAERRVASGELSPDSLEYDQYRVRVGRLVDDLQDALCYDFRVSNVQLDLLLNIARRGPGYLGGKLSGAGKGGCVSLLVRENQSEAMCQYLDREYYGKPEYFEFYREVLADERKLFRPGSLEYTASEEQLRILDAALASPQDQRRVVTFSRGACVIEPPE